MYNMAFVKTYIPKVRIKEQIELQANINLSTCEVNIYDGYSLIDDKFLSKEG